MFSFLHSTWIRTLNNNKAALTFPLNTFVLKNDLIFLCVYFGLEAIVVAVFLYRAIAQNILGVTTKER